MTRRGGRMYFAGAGQSYVFAFELPRRSRRNSTAEVFDTRAKRVHKSMFCPRCGQQQVSDEVRFCSRCGLSLASVPAMLAVFEAAPSEGVSRGGRLKKRKQVRRGAKLMFLSAVLFPIFFGFAILDDSPGPLVVPLTVFLAGLAWMLYFIIFGEEDANEPAKKVREGLREGRNAPSLPPATFAPASGFGARRANTADMAQPPSVTEQTTKLLDQE